jgi:hypothetical protein
VGSAADAIANLTGVKPTGESKAESTYNIPADDNSPAASAMRNMLGIAKPSSFDERFDATRDRPLEPFKRAEDKPTKPDNFGQILTGFENQQLAASQRTAPSPSNYKRPISSDVYENDAGEALYNDPVTNQLVKTDRNKHVLLRDPEDNRLKVYARSPETDEGVLSAAGRMLGTGLASGAPTSRTFQAASVARPAEEVISASKRLGVDVPRIVSSDSAPVQEIGSVAANVPLAGTPLVKAASKTIGQLGEKATEVAGGFGSKASVAEAGDVAKQSIKDWVTTGSSATADKLYSKVDSLVDQTIKTPLTKTAAIVDKINSEREAAGLGKSKAGELVASATGRPEGLTYDGVKTLRTSIGEQLKSGVLPEGISQGELKRVYGSLTEDLGSAVNRSGSKAAVDAFDRANTYYKLASQRRESLVKIIGGDANASAETVFNKIQSMAGSTSRADIGKLAQARKVMGSDDWNEVASTVVTKLGRDVDGNFSPRRFLTDYNKISPAGKNLLFKGGGKSDLAKSLDDIATISSRFKELEKFSNPSGTSRSVTGFVMAGGAWHGLAKLAAGSFGEPLTMLSGVLGGNVVSRILASPAGASSAAKWSRANLLLAQTPTPARLAAFSGATKNLLSTTGVKDVSVNDFLKMLQSPSVSHADDKQGIPRPPSQ